MSPFYLANPNVCHIFGLMKRIFIILFVLVPLTTFSQVIDWGNFNERHMDTVMFNVMNSYRHQEFKDSLTWSPKIQNDIMWVNYNFIKDKTHLNIHSLHNPYWNNNLDETIYKYDVHEEMGVDNGETRQAFIYSEILISIPVNKRNTYQSMANHAINMWAGSSDHAAHMNAHYQNKVIVGTITLYCQKTQRVFISFVYVS